MTGCRSCSYASGPGGCGDPGDGGCSCLEVAGVVEAAEGLAATHEAADLEGAREGAARARIFDRDTRKVAGGMAARVETGREGAGEEG